MSLATLKAVCPLLKDFDDGDLDALQDASSRHEVPPGHPLLSAGDANECLYFVLSGAVDVRRGMGSRIVDLAQLHVGDTFGEISMLTARPCTADLCASEAVSVLEIRRSRLHELFDSRPGLAAQFWMNLTRALAARLANTNDLLAKHLTVNDEWLGDDEFLRMIGPD